MKRIQLFEFEDFNWLPGPIRAGITNLIVVFHHLMKSRDVLSSLILSIREKRSFDQIVDMGSGSGGIMPEVQEKLKSEGTDLRLLLSDLHPSPQIVRRYEEDAKKDIQYWPESINATDLGKAPEGLKTMVNCFHHMPPNVAKEILRSAQENDQSLMIFEIAENKIPTLLWWLFLPVSLVILIIMSLFMTPFVRPLTPAQLFWTYIIPVIPIIYAWDGQASLVRTYTFDDIESLLPEPSETYVWHMEPGQKADGKKLGYYILGMPT
jgi:hypothetical protein